MVSQTPPTAPVRRRGLGWARILLILAVLGLAGWYLATALAPVAAAYATVELSNLRGTHEGDCLIVRDEVPYDTEAITKIVYNAAEGGTIYRGQEICSVYSSGYSTKETAALQNYRDQIRDYQRTLISSQTTYDPRLERLEAEVLDLAREFRRMIAGGHGSLTNQETLLDAAIQNRQTFLREKFSSDQRLSRLYDDEQSQLQRIDSWTKQYVGTGPGIVSFYSDGYEYGLTRETYASFTPAEVRSMIGGKRPKTISAAKTTIYRVINEGPWYVLMLVKDAIDWNPVEGQQYRMKLARFGGGEKELNAVVESFSRMGGELLVRLRMEASDVTEVLYTRTCQATLGEDLQTLRVPARALYVQDNTQGVVVAEGSSRLFIPINVLMRDGDYVYITAVQQELLHVGQTVLLF